MKEKIYIPDFFIIGAPRCGTTSIFHYLSASKEIYFFPELSELFRNNHSNYIFEGSRKDLFIGEDNPFYLYDKYVPERIFKINPNAKFIIILRNPVERAISHYYLKRRKGEEIFSLKKAIQREIKFLAKNNLIKKTVFPYMELGYYEEQITRYLKYFKKNQFLFISFESLSNEPKDVLLQIANFLDISNEFIGNEFIKHNSAKSSGYIEKSRILTVVVYILRTSIYLISILIPVKIVKKYTYILMTSLSHFMYSFNKKKGVSKEVLDEEFINFLSIKFKNKNSNIQLITGIKLFN